MRWRDSWTERLIISWVLIMFGILIIAPKDSCAWTDPLYKVGGQGIPVYLTKVCDVPVAWKDSAGTILVIRSYWSGNMKFSAFADYIMEWDDSHAAVQFVHCVREQR